MVPGPAVCGTSAPAGGVESPPPPRCIQWRSDGPPGRALPPCPVVGLGVSLTAAVDVVEPPEVVPGPAGHNRPPRQAGLSARRRHEGIRNPRRRPARPGTPALPDGRAGGSLTAAVDVVEPPEMVPGPAVTLPTAPAGGVECPPRPPVISTGVGGRPVRHSRLLARPGLPGIYGAARAGANSRVPAPRPERSWWLDGAGAGRAESTAPAGGVAGEPRAVRAPRRPGPAGHSPPDPGGRAGASLTAAVDVVEPPEVVPGPAGSPRPPRRAGLSVRRRPE
jgi:hypothetical protein